MELTETTEKMIVAQAQREKLSQKLEQVGRPGGAGGSVVGVLPCVIGAGHWGTQPQRS